MSKWYVVLSDGATFDAVAGCKLVRLNEHGAEVLETTNDMKAVKYADYESVEFLQYWSILLDTRGIVDVKNPEGYDGES